MHEDPCLYWTKEAVRLANDYQELTLQEVFLESEEDVNKRQQSNDKVKGGVFIALKRALDAVLAMISDILTKVSNAIQKLFMSEEQKKLFEEYEAKIKSDPETAKKSVKIADFKKIDAAYIQALRDADKAAAQEADPSIADQIMATLKENLSKITIACGVAAAITACKNSQKIAEGISKTLNKEEGIVKALQSKIGKQNVDDIKKEANKCSRKTFWERFKVNLCKQQQQTFVDKFKSNMSLIASFIPGTKAANDPKNKATKLNMAADFISNPNGAKVASKILKGASKIQSAKANFRSMRKKK